MIPDPIFQLLFQALEPWPERLHSDYSLIYAVARVEATQGRIRKIPFPGVEAKALVDHPRFVAPVRLSWRTGAFVKEDRLASAGVASPLVENEHADKIMQVFHLAQLFIRQKIMQRDHARVGRITRAELRAGLARNP